jgi:acyl-CoA oxidase
MSHGSNTRGVKTTAHYDPRSEEFIINTPTIEDSKIWVGNLGKTATHSAVYAQLYTPDGQCHGLHIFVVPIRDMRTMQLLPGVIAGDMGPKAGQNGIDNGFATFNQVRIPRENLLNRTGDVTPEGKYVTPYKDPSKRFGVSLGALSNGRVGLTHYAPCFMNQSLTIAIRYAAVRKQFGPDPSKDEIPIIEYQLHQYRLMPALAQCYVWRNFSTTFFADLGGFLFSIMMGDKSDKVSELGKEIHALSCASKPISSWAAQQVIQECREACGGHGYLKASRFGDMRNNNDPLLTFEGDNNVLIQQTSNHLISVYEEYLKTNTAPDTPLRTSEFLKRYPQTVNLKFTAKNKSDLLNKSAIMQMFEWLLCYILRESYQKLQESLKSGKDLFQARNDNQAFFSKTLAIVFMEREICERFIRKISENKDSTLQSAIDRIFYLAALHYLDKHVVLFYQGGYFTGQEGKEVTLIRETILDLCSQMKNDAIGLIDAIAPPDYVLNSALGDSTGLVYKNLYSSMIQSDSAFRPIEYLDQFMKKTPFGSLRSQL